MHRGGFRSFSIIWPATRRCPSANCLPREFALVFFRQLFGNDVEFAAALAPTLSPELISMPCRMLSMSLRPLATPSGSPRPRQALVFDQSRLGGLERFLDLIVAAAGRAEFLGGLLGLGERVRRPSPISWRPLRNRRSPRLWRLP